MIYPDALGAISIASSFFATLKLEAVQERVFAIRSEAHMVIFDYIEVFYNRQRLHCSSQQGCLSDCCSIKLGVDQDSVVKFISGIL